jgi:hypothetical protein
LRFVVGIDVDARARERADLLDGAALLADDDTGLRGGHLDLCDGLAWHLHQIQALAFALLGTGVVLVLLVMVLVSMVHREHGGRGRRGPLQIVGHGTHASGTNVGTLWRCVFHWSLLNCWRNLLDLLARWDSVKNKSHKLIEMDLKLAKLENLNLVELL